MKFPELAHCEVGEVKTLATCLLCDRIVRIYVMGTDIVMRAHRRKGERCENSQTNFYGNYPYSLQQVVKVGRGGKRKIKLAWVRI
jgi:hypothetical protein